jgi:predicted anti-sigma-YlaC factor YlaD
MPNCQETLKELELFLDSELPKARVEEIMLHLTGCTDCQGAFEFHAELRTIVRVKAKRDLLPDGFTERLLACFEPLSESD